MARNAGLKRVRGEAVAFIDSDDLPEVTMLECLHKALISQGADMAMARYEARIEARWPQEISLQWAQKTDLNCSGEALLKGLFDYVSPLCKALYAKLFRREVLQGLCFEKLRTGEDIDYLSKVYPHIHVCACVDQILYRYNDWQESIMHTQRASDYQEMLTVYDHLVRRLSDAEPVLYGQALDALMRKVVSSRYRNRKLRDKALDHRLNELTDRYLSAYVACENGNRLVKGALWVALKLPWLHALIMNIRER